MVKDGNGAGERPESACAMAVAMLHRGGYFAERTSDVGQEKQWIVTEAAIAARF